MNNDTVVDINEEVVDGVNMNIVSSAAAVSNDSDLEGRNDNSSVSGNGNSDDSSVV